MPIGELFFMKKLSAVKLNFVMMIFTAALTLVLQSCGEKSEDIKTTDKTVYVDTISVEAKIS